MRFLFYIIPLLWQCACGARNGSPAADSSFVATAEDRAVAERVMASLKSGEMGEMTAEAAKEMLGVPYVGGILDEGEEEVFRLPLEKTDCIIFVEACLNLARTVKECGNDAGFDDFAGNVRRMRYRGGVVDGYASRVHYTTEWIRQGERIGILEDKTTEAGGKVYDHPVSFMSSHSGSYPHINEDNIQAIRDVEASLNKEPMTYIPSSGVARAERFIRDGDIICFVSKVEGLDISHVGIALRHDGVTGFIHASTTAGKVVVDDRSVSAYVLSRPKSIAGIKIVRPL